MKTLQIISVCLTGLIMFSNLVCGLWMRYSGEVLTEGSKNFHMLSGILTTLLVLNIRVSTLTWLGKDIKSICRFTLVQLTDGSRRQTL